MDILGAFLKKSSSKFINKVKVPFRHMKKRRDDRWGGQMTKLMMINLPPLEEEDSFQVASLTS